MLGHLLQDLRENGGVQDRLPPAGANPRPLDDVDDVDVDDGDVEMLRMLRMLRRSGDVDENQWDNYECNLWQARTSRKKRNRELLVGCRDLHQRVV
jgi:hypothetical protein